jgi:hypothetical protein
VSGSRIFAGGQFTIAGGQTRHRLASLDATTGLATGWNPDAAGDPTPSATSLVYTLSVGGSKVYAGGSFPGINGQGRACLAAIDAADPAALTAAVISPDGGDILHIGSHKTLEWSASGGHGVASVDLYLSRTGPGGPFELITMGIASTGTYDWTVTGPTVASNAYLKVQARDWSGDLISDVSNAAFTIDEDVTSVPGRSSSSFALYPLAPNPVVNAAELSFSVPYRTHVRIQLLDVTGRQVALLSDGMREPGRNVTTLDARRLRAGLYFVSLQSGGENLRQRVVVIR